MDSNKRCKRQSEILKKKKKNFFTNGTQAAWAWCGFYVSPKALEKMHVGLVGSQSSGLFHREDYIVRVAPYFIAAYDEIVVWFVEGSHFSRLFLVNKHNLEKYPVLMRQGLYIFRYLSKNTQYS